MYKSILFLLTINCCILTMMPWSSQGARHAPTTGVPLPLPPSPPNIMVNVVVSQDPTIPGACKSINEGLMRAPADGTRFVIYVMAGRYEEYITVNRRHVTLVGDGIGKTIITGGSHNDDDTFTTSMSPTLIVEGEGFIGVGITVENTAGPLKDQAVAMRVSAKHAAFYKCSFEGYQYTVYQKEGNQFYRECQIYGTVDFIFSETGRVVFQDCDIYVRDPTPKIFNTITADGRNVSDDINGGGIVIHHSKVLPTPGLLNAMAAAGKTIHAYLGRPWGDYSRTVIMSTYIDSFVDPAGWVMWENAPPQWTDTIYYAEYNNCGPGAAIDNRIKWGGYNRPDFDPSKFTVAQFIDGNSWLPSTGVPFSPGLDQPCLPPPKTI